MSQTARWCQVYLALPLVPALVETAVRFVIGSGELTLAHAIPWVTLVVTAFTVTSFVRDEVAKYNIVDSSSDELESQRAFQSMFSGYLMWFGAVLGMMIAFQVLIDVHRLAFFRDGYLATRIFAAWLIICLALRVINAQLRFKLKVSP